MMKMEKNGKIKVGHRVGHSLGHGLGPGFVVTQVI
jgi:hypothetical protein